MTELLRVTDLSVSFTHETKGLIHAVREVSLSINKGETVAVVGESGAGKSQLFHALMGLQANNANVQGSARFLGQQLLNQSDKTLNKIRGTQMSIIFQDPMTALNPYLKVGKQLTEVLQVHKQYSKAKAKKEVIKALSEVKIPQPERRLYQYPHELSGGMRQRVMIAMALLGKPKLIIADEPTTALDVTVQTDIISLLRDIHVEHQTSIILITHDIPLVSGLCQRLIIMYAGKIVEMGSLAEIHASAQHPYTRALLKATPANVTNKALKRLSMIPGQPPDPSELPKGCAFAPRCEHANERCKVQPEMIEISQTHSVACFNRNNAR